MLKRKMDARSKHGLIAATIAINRPLSRRDLSHKSRFKRDFHCRTSTGQADNAPLSLIMTGLPAVVIDNGTG